MRLTAVATVACKGGPDQTEDVGVTIEVEERIDAVDDLSVIAQVDRYGAGIASAAATASVVTDAVATIASNTSG